MSQNTSSEEDFTLTNTEKVGVQLEGSDLLKRHIRSSYEVLLHVKNTQNIFRFQESSFKSDYSKIKSTTILSQACFPSMNPLGIALGVRISYL